jgi:hypothetical protein
MIPRVAFFLALAAVGIVPASAQSKFYAGGAAGRVHLDSDFADQVNGSRSGDVLPPADIRSEARGRTGGRVFGGYRLVPTFAVEADYFTLGEIATGYTTFADSPTVLPDNLSGRAFSTFEHTSRVRGYGIYATALLPVAGNLNLVTRAGVARLRSTLRGQVTSFLPRVDTLTAPGVVQYAAVSIGPTEARLTQSRPVASVGVDYRLSDRLHVRATWDRYFRVGKSVGLAADAVGKHDIDLIALGMTFDF